jgi:hypothetical protein
MRRLRLLLTGVLTLAFLASVLSISVVANEDERLAELISQSEGVLTIRQEGYYLFSVPLHDGGILTIKYL